MDVTAAHIHLIGDFVEARIDEQFSGDHAPRNWETDPTARTLRALRRVVREIKSRAILEERTEPALTMAVDLTMTFAWGELAAIAQEWQDHPDYLPQFALLAHQLGVERELADGS